ncbi:MAG: TonB-dependent receptor [Steroidobacter sp.]|nr:TonB-dependent receptor [Steroidobacter sp.]
MISRYPGLAASIATVLACHATAAVALDASYFNLPSQPLSASLSAIGTQSSVNIVFDASLVDGIIAPPLNAELSIDQALARVLKGSGIQHRFLDERTIVLSATASSNSASRPSKRVATTGALLMDESAPSARLRLAQAEQAASTSTAEVAKSGESLEEVVVTGLNFNYQTVESANKMPLSTKDTPQSLKLITEDVIDFASIKSFEDAYKIDASGVAAHAQDGYIRNFYRGFRVSYGSGTNTSAIKVDGFRMTGGINLDLAPFERFEIIKGSTSTMYGQSQVAGTLNAISKKPQAEPGGSISVEGGSYNHYRADFDAYGALTDDQRLQGRIVAAYLDEESYVDYGFNKRYVIAPSIKYEFNDDTSVLVRAQYQNYDFSVDFGRGLQYLGGDPDAAASYRIPNVSRSLYTLGMPVSKAATEALFLQAVAEHRFGNDWMFRGSVQSNHFNGERNALGHYGVMSPDGLLPVTLYDNENDDDVFSGEVNLFGDVELFGRDHTLFFGFDYARYDGSQQQGYLVASGETTGFGINDLDFSLLPRHPSSIGAYDPDQLPAGTFDEVGVFKGKYDNKEYGATLQAILKPTDDLKVILGARYSKAELATSEACCSIEEYRAPLGPYQRIEADAWTYQAGMTYAFTRRVNGYINYGDTFVPRTDVGEDGNFLGPERGKSYEIGFKGDLFAGRLSWSTALFRLERGPLAESVLNTPYSRLLGEQRSQGIEVDMQGEVLSGWDVYLSLAAMENEYVGGEFDGYPSPFGPRAGASFYSSYEIQEGAWRGFGAGGGIVYKHRGTIRPFFGPAAGARFENLFDDYTEVDLRVFYYGLENWRFELGVTNVFNELYYSPDGQDLSVEYGISPNPAREFIGRITRTF